MRTETVLKAEAGKFKVAGKQSLSPQKLKFWESL
jgi:hypothetical protein